MTKLELEAAITEATAKCAAAWAGWVLVRDAGQKDVRCAEFQAHNAAQAVLSDLFRTRVTNPTRDRRLAEFSDRVASGQAADRRDNPDMYR